MKTQQGNALFLILIAVALFAALSYAITQSGRGGGSVDRETRELQVSQIFQYAASLQQAVLRMQIAGGVEDEDLDFSSTDRLNFDDSVVVKNNTNCTESNCEIYNPAGGGVTYRDFEELALASPTGYLTNYTKPGHWEPMVAKIEGVGTDLPEIVARLMSVNQDVCYLINEKLGLPETTLKADTGGTYYSMVNDPSPGLSATDATTYGNDYPELAGQMSFCQHDTASSNENGYYIHVLKAR